MVRIPETTGSVGEGKQITFLIVVSFVVLALMGMVMIAIGKATAEQVLSFYAGLGVLAKLFSFDTIIQSWFDTRGQTSLNADK